MIRDVLRATGALLRDLYHFSRLCPECRDGRVEWNKFLEEHRRRKNLRLQVNTFPSARSERSAKEPR